MPDLPRSVSIRTSASAIRLAWWSAVVSLTAFFMPVHSSAAANPVPRPSTIDHRSSIIDSLVVKVDSVHRQVIITIGPFQLPAMKHDAMPGMAMGGMDMSHATTPLRRFNWPVSFGLHGFKTNVVDAQGRPVTRAVLHHYVLVNFGRRSLVHPMFERLAGAGKETADVSLPPSLTVPMDRGMPLGVYCMWHNDTGKDIDQVFLQLTLEWTPPNMVPAPINALPFYLDVNERPDANNDYDLPIGHSEKIFSFQLPVGGKLLALGGHMHDYGVSVRLEDVTTAKASTVTELNAELNPKGTILSMGRKFFGAAGDGLPLRADHKYRLVGTYQNPTGHALPQAAMASVMGLYVPDVLSRWPKVDLSDPILKQDMAWLHYQPDAPR